MSKRSPNDFLKAVLGHPVIVKLNSGVEYRGQSAMQMAQERVEPARSAAEGPTIASTLAWDGGARKRGACARR